jgi:hypothetical protein
MSGYFSGVYPDASQRTCSYVLCHRIQYRIWEAVLDSHLLQTMSLELAMPPNPGLDAEDMAFLEAWDGEIEAEQAEELALQRQVRADEMEARARAGAEWAPMRAALMELAGTSEADVRKRADEEFAQARETAAARREKALAILEKRVAATRAEVKKLLSGMERK